MCTAADATPGAATAPDGAVSVEAATSGPAGGSQLSGAPLTSFSGDAGAACGGFKLLSCYSHFDWVLSWH